MIEFTLNGRDVATDAPGDTPAAYLLRNEFAMKSVRLGCEAEQCGACKVLVDGAVRCSCTLPTDALAGHRVTTVEGLATHAGVLTALQASFEAHNATQCGFCLSGILIAATALFEQDPQPSAGAIRSALRDNLCRCGAQPRVLRALAELAGAS